MTSGILQAKGLCKSYKDKQVLKNLDITIEPGKIYGLIGRNGAGKTTLLGILTAQNTHDSGEVTYNGEPVWENPKALADLCFSRELQATLFYGQNNLKVRHYLQAGATFYPRWDEEYARRLLKEFGVEEKKRVSQLKGRNLDIRPKATSSPSGMLSTSVRMKMTAVITKPSPSCEKIACMLTAAGSRAGIGMRTSSSCRQNGG